jgi:UDP-4-amino-4,6-dideoxy-N-acetyl-beta-L-altrosamine transaminase
MKIIPYSKQFISKKDKLEVNKVLSSDFITSGPKVELFEKKVKTFSNAKYAVAVNSATSALHIACMSLGLKSNDLLWTVPNSFVASANCGLYCGAKIDFVDIDNDTLNISINQLEQKLISSHKRKKLPKILVVVHFAGASCEMDRIKKLSNKYKFRIIEDASHAIGGDFNNYKVGSCKYSDITVFSFHPVKIITSGEGGIALTNNKDLAKSMSYLRSHGIIRDKKVLNKKKEIQGYYEQKYLGYNYRITDIQCALGISQMDMIKNFITYRNKIAKLYIKSLKNLDLKFQKIPSRVRSTYHLFIIRVNKTIKKKLFEEFINNKIFVNTHYIPIHTHPFYKKKGFKNGDFKVSENYYKESISIPIFYNLKNSEQIKVIKIIKKFIKIRNK